MKTIAIDEGNAIALGCLVYASGIERDAESGSPEENCDRRLVSSVTRGCSRREKRVECPESRASMKYIEGCVLLLFRKGRKCRADASTP